MKILGVVRVLPLFAILWVGYNILYVLEFYNALPFAMANPVFAKPLALPSKVEWNPTINDLTIFFGLFILYIEIFKSTDVSDTQIVEHILSFFTFLVYLFEFLFFAPVGNTTFLILCAMSLIDVIAGFTISISAGRRDISIGGGIG